MIRPGSKHHGIYTLDGSKNGVRLAKEFTNPLFAKLVKELEQQASNSKDKNGSRNHVAAPSDGKKIKDSEMPRYSLSHAKTHRRDSNVRGRDASVRIRERTQGDREQNNSVGVAGNAKRVNDVYVTSSGKAGTAHEDRMTTINNKIDLDILELTISEDELKADAWMFE